MVNRVILIGNLGRDPEVRRLENGAVVAKFSLATNESYKDKSGEWQDQTEWHDIILWRSLAERAEQSLKKGNTVYVEGKLTHRTWQDQEGNNRKTTEVVGNYFRLLDRKQSSGGSNYFPNPQDEPAMTGSGSAKVADDFPSMPEGVDDDLPF